MQYVGFVEELDSIKEAVPFKQLVGEVNCDDRQIKKIIFYLENGLLFWEWMSYFRDLETGELVGPYSYLTDGIWIWPSYFPYYIKKYPSCRIDPTFLSYLEANKFTLPKLDGLKINELEKEFIRKRENDIFK